MIETQSFPQRAVASVSQWSSKVVSCLMLIALFLGVSPGVVKAQETPIETAREKAIDLVMSDFPNVSDAAQQALRGDDRELREFVAQGYPEALRADYELILASMSRMVGPLTAARARELMESGDLESIESFLDGGWQSVQEKDDRATAERYATGDPDDAVTQWAQDALKQANSGDPEALFEFATDGYVEARRHDYRRKLYELAASELPSVAAGADAALRSESDAVYEQYVLFGQFADAAVDQELSDVTKVAEQIRKEIDTAYERYEGAVAEAERAAAAAESARVAAERAAQRREQAASEFVTAERGAYQAAELARFAGKAADEAVAAANEAHNAMIQTAQAMNRAAAAMAGAANASAEAHRFASAAAQDAAVAYDARVKAEKAERFARQVNERSWRAAQVAASEYQANRAGHAAAQAGRSAASAGAAADRAAGYVGVSETAAAQARAGAAMANAAASRAESAAGRVQNLINELVVKVSEVETAAKNARIQSDRAAKAAFEAAAHAGTATGAAEKAEEQARASRTASDSAESYAQLARSISELASRAQQAQFDQERERRIHEAQENAILEERLEQQRTKDADWEPVARKLLPSTYPEVNSDDEAQWQKIPDDELFEHVLFLAAHAPEPLRASAGAALIEETTDALEDYRYIGLVVAMDQYRRGQVHYWYEHGTGEVAQRAGEVAEESEAEIENFLNSELPQLRSEQLNVVIRGIVESLEQQNAEFVSFGEDPLYKETVDSAHRALASTDSAEKEKWISHGLREALVTDARIAAYNSLDIYGPYTRLESEVAINGSNADLSAYLFELRPQAIGQDAQRQAVKSQIESLHATNDQLVELSRQVAAEAESIAAFARKAAGQASEYEKVARDHQAKAEEFAALAQHQLENARRHLDLAREHGRRANAAAGRARADATTASGYSTTATQYAVITRSHAAEARTAADEAYASAAAAGEDAAGARRAAERTRQFHEQQELNERFDAQRATAEGHGEPYTSLWDVVTEYMSDNGVNILKDLVGITDIENCLAGQFSGCLWTLANFVPPGAIAKLGGVIRKLAKHAPEIIDTYRARKAARAGESACPAFFRCAGGPSYRQLSEAEKERIRAAGGKAYWADGRKFEAADDFRVVAEWIPSSGLEKPLIRLADEGGQIRVVSMTHEEAERLRKIVSDKRDGKDVLDQLTVNERMINDSFDKLEDGTYALKASAGPMPSILKIELLRGKLKNKLDKKFREVGMRRLVGGDSAQNRFAYVSAEVHRGHKGYHPENLVTARLNQSLSAKRADGALRRVKEKRPDLQFRVNKKVKDKGGVNLGLYENGIFTEFDSRSSNRAFGHGGSALFANPGGTVLLVELDSSMLSKQAQEALKDYAERVAQEAKAKG